MFLDIILNVDIDHKKDVLKMIADILQGAGCVEKGYYASMQKRETVTSTYIGSSLAIPHGFKDDLSLIKKTGIVILQIPKGVIWKDESPTAGKNETVHIAVGICASGTEHIQILKKLTKIVMDAGLAQKLANTKEKSDFYDIFETNLKTVPTNKYLSHIYKKKYPYTNNVHITCTHGFHARPAALIVSQSWAKDIVLSFDSTVARADSVSEILSLGVSHGSKVLVGAKNTKDLDSALIFLCKNLDEEQEKDNSQSPSISSMDFPTYPTPKNSVLGVGASPGIGIAPLFVIEDNHKENDLDTSKSNSNDNLYQRQIFEKALQVAESQLDILIHKLENDVDVKTAKIFTSHKMLLKDNALLETVYEHIDNGRDALLSWKKSIDEQITILKNNKNSLIQERIIDLQDISDRVVRILSNGSEKEQSYPDTTFILLANDLTPSKTTTLPKERIRGLITAEGGKTSHTAIIANAYGIPAVVGIGSESFLKLQSKTKSTVIVNGTSGFVDIDPSKDRLEKAISLMNEIEKIRKDTIKNAYKPAITTDGHRVEINANVETIADVKSAIDKGGEGVGLFRTELMYQNCATAPTIDTYLADILTMGKHLNGLPLIMRVLDIGGDKPVSFMNVKQEQNPFLGLRGVRLLLEYPDIFVEQLTASFLAHKQGIDIRVMIPMIGGLEDWNALLPYIDKARKNAGGGDMQIGIMIELPSAAIIAEKLAQKVDFFSIGTNDLTQYTLAMDRLNPKLAQKIDSLHPSVLFLMKKAIDAIHKENKKIGVCGNMASTSEALLLVGMGVDELSVSPVNIPLTKQFVRSLSYEQAKNIADKAIGCSTSEEVRSLL